MNISRLLLQARAELSLTLRNGEQLLLTFVIPLVLLGFFGSVDVLPLDAWRDPLDVLVPGVLAVAVMSSAMVSLGIATGFERSYRVLKLLGTTPLRRSELVAAKAVSVFAVEVVQAVLLVALGLALGWRPHDGRAVLVIPAVLLGSLAFAGIGLLLAGSLRAEVNLAAQNGLYLLLLLGGGALIPASELPRAAEAVAGILPSHALAKAMEASLSGLGGSAISHWAVLAAWAVVAPVLAARRFRWW
ncbi:MAG: ABC transporter permease [Ilumatobacteraceae bacterium]